MTIFRVSLLAIASVCWATAQAQVRVVPNEAAHRVDVTIDGAPFTSYLWNTNQRKPVLYPLIAPDGTTVTRGYPFAQITGERTDHPHHAGLWFNYGNANGFDFWNNSDAIKPENRAKYGFITHDKIVSAKSGRSSGELKTTSTWIAGDPAAGNTKPLLTQTTRYVFSKLKIGSHSARAIDVIVTLKALAPVTFNNDKEGLLGLRVAHFLESATEKGVTFRKLIAVCLNVARCRNGTGSPYACVARSAANPVSAATPSHAEYLRRRSAGIATTAPNAYPSAITPLHGINGYSTSAQNFPCSS